MRYRSIIVGTLGVAILAGFSVDILQRHKGQLWALGLPFLCLFEYTLSSLPFPSPTEPVHLPRVYVDLSADSKPYGIVEFPCDMLSPHDLHPEYFALLNKLNQQQLFYQIFHGKGLGMVDKANLSREVYQTPLLRKIQQLAFQKTVPIIGEEQNDSLEWFENRGFHYIIIHDAYIPPTNRASIHIYLQQELGAGEHYPSDQVWLYSFPNQESQ